MDHACRTKWGEKKGGIIKGLLVNRSIGTIGRILRESENAQRAILT